MHLHIENWIRNCSGTCS